MENKFRNEMEITLSGQKILLRPTFENLAAMEGDLGGIAYLAYKYGQGIDIEARTVDQLKSAKAMPPITEAAKIFFFNQAEKKFTLEEIYGMCLDEGLKVCAQAVLFLVRVSAGNKLAKEPTRSQKKSSVKENPVENP
jgi:hypothetical protein